MPIQLGRNKRSQHTLPSIDAARACIIQNQLQEALELLNNILAQSPENAVALALRGQTYGRIGNLSNSLVDFRHSLELAPNDAETHLNYAIALAKDKQGSEALAEVSRVLQLTPDDEETWAWRKHLARVEGLEELDEAACVLEKFAYTQCGNGLHWRVALRQMYRFQPHQPYETYNAAVLDLHQTPHALIELTTSQGEYKLKLMAERRSPEVNKSTFAEVISETSPAEPTALIALLESLISRGILKKMGDRLQYAPC